MIIPRYFDTQIAISEFLGHKIVSSLFSNDMFAKSESIDDILPRKQFYFKDNGQQNKIACILLIISCSVCAATVMESAEEDSSCI